MLDSPLVSTNREYISSFHLVLFKQKSVVSEMPSIVLHLHFFSYTLVGYTTASCDKEQKVLALKELAHQREISLLKAEYEREISALKAKITRLKDFLEPRSSFAENCEYYN